MVRGVHQAVRWILAAAVPAGGAACLLPSIEPGEGPLAGDGGNGASATGGTSGGGPGGAAGGGAEGGAGATGGAGPPPGSLAWVHVYGDAADQRASTLTVGPSGEISISGSFAGSLVFDSGAVAADTLGQSVYLAKLTSDGTASWARKLTSTQELYAISLDTSGSGWLLFGGMFAGQVDLGTGIIPYDGTLDGVVARIQPNGTTQWARSIRSPGPGNTGVSTVAFDASGNALATGAFYSTMNVSSGCEEVTSAGARDVFITKLDRDFGNCQWVLSAGDALEQLGRGLDVDAAGNAYVTGYAAGSIAFGGQAWIGGADKDVFLVKVAPDGAPVWSARYGSPAADQSGEGLVVTADGIVVTGSFADEIDFGGPTLTSTGGLDGFIAKLTFDGRLVWQRAFAGTADQIPQRVVVDEAGDILVIGRFYGATDLGGGAIEAEGEQDVFVVKLDDEGEHLWSRGFGHGGMDYEGGLGVDPSSGAAILSGTLYTGMDLGGGPLETAGGTDVFLAKYWP